MILHLGLSCQIGMIWTYAQVVEVGELGAPGMYDTHATRGYSICHHPPTRLNFPLAHLAELPTYLPITLP